MTAYIPPQIDLNEVRQIFVDGKTQWRGYMNNHSRAVRLESPVLDIGTGAYGSASYQRYIPGYKNSGVVSLDLDPKRRPSALANLNHPLPFGDQTFNTCLSYGVLEYLYPPENIMRELHRVLKPNGMVYLVVPFFDRIASDFGDAMRLTGRGFRMLLEQTGFNPIAITPHGSGACGAALDQIEFGIPRPLRGIAFRTALFMDKQITKRSGGKFRNANDYPLGYVVVAQKIG